MRVSASAWRSTAIPTSCWSTKCCRSATRRSAAARWRRCAALIASGKTVLFISHDMWNVRRLCSDILWMENGSVRAYGEAGAIAERYMNEVNLQALQNQATSLQSHRGGTGEVRFEQVDLFDGDRHAGRDLQAERHAGDSRRIRGVESRSSRRSSRSRSSTSTPAWS